ncbi:MAG: hypothetical protein IKC49_01510 [Clostridia bacterium]|nr:hypothetical protein [Clostridia bacterium]
MLLGEQKFKILPFSKYSIDGMDNTSYVVFSDSGAPYVFDMTESKKVVHFEYGRDRYFILTKSGNIYFNTVIKFMSSLVSVSLGEKLNVTIDGEIVVEECIGSISYSHFEIRKNCLIIYFKGIRDYVVIIKDKKLMIASFYDEINIFEGELVFMCKCLDSIGHGRVFLLNKNNEYDTYLVYIDKEIILGNEFIVVGFLDAVCVGNYKYANGLLDKNIRLDDEKGLKDFFLEFDEYIWLEENVFALIKKNTLSGIYKFEIKDSYITNITQLN